MISLHSVPALIPILLIAGSLLVVLIGLWRKEFAQPIATVTAFILSIVSLFGFLGVMDSGIVRYSFGGWAPPIGIEFVLDGLSGFFIVVINSVASLVLLHSAGIRKQQLGQKQTAYYALSLLLLLGLNGMVLTGDLFNLYVFLEISSLASYGLISIGSRQAPYAAFRYLIIGTVGGTFFLLGIGFLYAVTGTLNMIDMAGLLPQISGTTPVITALILIITGIGIKAALFPMYGWLPEAYTHANAISSSLIAPIGTKVAAYVLIRVGLFVVGDENLDRVVPLSDIVAILAGMGILFGSLMAISQNNLKRMLAFSSVSQIGYILMGIALMNPLGFAGALFHVLNHAIMKSALFLVAANIERGEGHTDLSRFDDSYRKKYPFTMAVFTLSAISMIGLPPMAGFFSKWMLALGTIEAGNWFLFIVILSSSLLNAVYFFRILERVYLKKSGQKESSDAEFNDSPWLMRIPAMVLGIALLVFGFTNAPILELIQRWFPL